MSNVLFGILFVAVCCLPWASGAQAHAAEPNDDFVTAVPLTFDGEGSAGQWSGQNGKNESLFRIETAQAQIADVYIETRKDASFELTLLGADGQEKFRGRFVGAWGQSRVLFEEGTTYLKLSAYAKETTPYRVFVYDPRPLGPNGETEPNDALARASVFAGAAEQASVFKGYLDEKDTDIVALETAAPVSLWRVDINGSDISTVKYLNAAGDALITAWNAGQRLSRASLQTLLLAPGRHFFEIRGSGHYRISAQRTGEAPPEVFSRSPAVDPQARYSEIEPNSSPGQAVPLADGQAREGVIGFAGDEDYYRFALAVPSNVRLTLSAVAPPTVHADLLWGLHKQTRMGRLSVHGEASAAAAKTETAERELEAGDYLLKIKSDGVPETPYRIRLEVLSSVPSEDENTLPSALIGRLAAQKAGWTLAAERAGKLVDGRASPHHAANLELHTEYRISVQAPATLPIKGMIIDTRHWQAPGNTLRGFRLEAESESGDRITLLEQHLRVKEGVYGFETAPGFAVKNFFFTPLAAGHEESRNVYVGEIMFIPLTPAEEVDIDLLSPLHGGMVLYAPTWLDTGILEPDDRSIQSLPPKDYRGGLFWVTGFRAGCTARIHRLTWKESSKAKPEHLLPAVDVYRSTTSPDNTRERIWDKIGTFTRADDRTMPDLVFASPVTARYLKFVAATGDAERKRWEIPDKIAAFEAPEGEKGRSLAGEWNDACPDASDAQAEAAPPSPPAADSAAHPRTLPLDTTVHGSVQSSIHEARYAVEIPPGSRMLSLALRHPRMLGVSPALYDETQQPVPLNLVTDEYTAEQEHTRVYEALVTPGAYNLMIREAPLSIAVAWDTSGSVSGFRPDILNAVRSAGRYAEAGRVMLNFFPFRDPVSKPLLPQWSGDAATLYGALQHYGWADSSSNMEGALIGASIALQQHQGSRAIILVTDGETTGSRQNAQSWDIVNRVKPRIYVTAIPGAQQGAENHLQHYAHAYGGGYMRLGGQHTFESNFEKTVEDLTGPKAYALTASASDEMPEPGFISVMLPPKAEAMQKDLLVVLDISGSMLQRFGGKRRIEIARQALEDVAKNLPSGLNLGLRTLGGATADLCDTRLRIPPAPLDRAGLRSILQGLTPVDGARTPIAGALLQVTEDFRANTAQDREKLVLLITDGEETCGGDPLAAVKALEESGLSVTVNIVGFAVEDARIKSAFQTLAEAGSGQYFDAANPDKITDALRHALLPAYRVEDMNGKVLARGTAGGEAVSVYPGTYNIVSDRLPALRFDDVQVQAGETVTLQME